MSPAVSSHSVRGIRTTDRRLLETGGNIYVAFGGQYGDCGNYSGWLIAYNADTLAQSGAIDLNPNSTQGGMWNAAGGSLRRHSGIRLCCHGQHRGWDSPSEPNDYPNSVVRLTNPGTLTVADYWTPFNAATLDQEDVDLGSAGVLILPDLVDNSSVVHHNAVAAGKDGNMYVVDRDNLGQFNMSTNNTVQTIATNGVNFSTPAYFNNNVYVCPSSQTLKAFAISNALLATTATMQTTTSIGTSGFTISANGTSNGDRLGDSADEWKWGSVCIQCRESFYDALRIEPGYGESGPDGPDSGELPYADGCEWKGLLWHGNYGRGVWTVAMMKLPASVFESDFV